MYVVKLNGGGLLLYAPVKVHRENPELLFSWLESLGPVQWLVAGSGAQIHLLPDAIKESGFLQWGAKSANFKLIPCWMQQVESSSKGGASIQNDKHNTRPPLHTLTYERAINQIELPN